MDARSFDRIAAALAETRTRRGALRWLAGVAGAAALAGRGPAEAEAKKGNNGGKRCRRGQRIASISIPADGSPVLTPVLARNRRYRIVARGVALGPDDWAVDAGYFSNSTPLFAVQEDACGAPGDTDVGLAIEGLVPDWGPFDESHVYRTVVTTDGDMALALSLRFCAEAAATSQMTADVYCA